jgi:ABC-type polysaccharide/polyol phosphate transport system ATPase subunit
LPTGSEPTLPPGSLESEGNGLGFAVDATNLSKAFRLGEHQTLARTIRWLTRREVESLNPWLTAIDSVSFTIPRGVAFGIAGRNGSGKSTLCQLIAGITPPTGGSLRVRGRVIPLLSLGQGYMPELTGRENVVLVGSILGLSRAEALEAVPTIARFAEVDRHIDTPIKRWSVGMQSRLYFAIAMCFEAEVYIFDEVIAVVDDEFRERCLAEMRALTKAGRTVIFISHDLDAARELCNQGMWLDRGRIRHIGPMDEVATAYEAAQEHVAEVT